MVAFSRNTNNCSKVDWAVLSNGSISLYYDEAILAKDLKWLKNNQYKIINLDFSIIGTIDEFHKRIKETCDFPDYYGENMSALSDCLLHDLDIPYEGGCVFTLKKFNLFFKKDKIMAHDILERLCEASRQRILTGERLITLLQSDDPLFSPDVIGAYKISLNRHEFVNKDRIKKQ